MEETRETQHRGKRGGTLSPAAWATIQVEHLYVPTTAGFSSSTETRVNKHRFHPDPPTQTRVRKEWSDPWKVSIS